MAVNLHVVGAKIGDVLWRSRSSNPNQFTVPGIDYDEVYEDGWYTYKATNLTFCGIYSQTTGLIDLTSKGETLKLYKVPTESEMPAGCTITWTAETIDVTNGSQTQAGVNGVTLEPSEDGLSCKVTPNVSGSYIINITADLDVGDSGVQVFDDGYHNYRFAQFSVRTGKKLEPDPVTMIVRDLNQNATICEGTGKSQLEIPQYTAYTLQIHSPTHIDKVNLNVHSEDDKATVEEIDAWNGTDGTYEIYAAGNVDDICTIIGQDKQILTLKIVPRPFALDKNSDVMLHVGDGYIFSVVPNSSDAILRPEVANDALKISVKDDGYPDASGRYQIELTEVKAVGNVDVFLVYNGIRYKLFKVDTQP